jgi:hypothetical protein
VISYMKQVTVGNSVRETIKQTLARSKDRGIRAKMHSIPATESILRVVSLFPNMNTEEELKDFITKHILSTIGLPATQQEQR